MPPQCPYANEVGRLQARVLMLERELEKLQSTAKVTANTLLEERAAEGGYWRGINISVRIVSALLIAGVLLAAGKFTGALELVFRLLKI
jgi:hypothetical protein